MLFCCLRRNVEASCHKHFVVVFRHQQTPPLTTSGKCHNLPRSGGTVLITPGGRNVDSTRWSDILVENSDFLYPTCIWRPRRYCHGVWYGKARMVWLPDGKFEDIFIRFGRIQERDGQTDGRTGRQTNIARRHKQCAAKSRQGNEILWINNAIVTFCWDF